MNEQKSDNSENLPNRSDIFTKIEQMYLKVVCFDRTCFFHAMTVLDHLYFKSPSIFHLLSQQQETLIFTALIMSHKFQTNRKIKMQAVLSKLGRRKDFLQQVVQMEETILNALDYQFPTTNAYEYLNSLIDSEDLKGENRKNIVISLKILLISLKLTPIISLEPQIGQSIHQITLKNFNVSETTKRIYKMSFDFLKSQKNSFL